MYNILGSLEMSSAIVRVPFTLFIIKNLFTKSVHSYYFCVVRKIEDLKNFGPYMVKILSIGWCCIFHQPKHIIKNHFIYDIQAVLHVSLRMSNHRCFEFYKFKYQKAKLLYLKHYKCFFIWPSTCPAEHVEEQGLV